MKVFAMPRPDEVGKFQGIVQAFPDIWEGLILDVGCRSGNLKQVLPVSVGIRYCGLDLFPPADVLGNLEIGLPFKDASFDAVVALDVLEHTNSIHMTFGELCRVARKYVLITLPNAYEIKSRFKFLLGQRLSGKYGLPLEAPLDRHRWLFSFKEAKAFVQVRGQLHGFEVIAEGCLIGPRRAFAAGQFFVSQLPNLLSPWYVALLRACLKD